MELIDAIKDGDIQRVKTLLEEGKSPNETDSNGYTPLMFATSEENIDIVKLLLEHGANPNATDTDGYTPILIAVELKYTDIINLLIENGADVLKKYGNDRTLLQIAVEFNYVDIIELLISKGVDINNKETQYGNTALIYAVYENYTDIVKILINHNADTNIKDIDEKSSLYYAVLNNNIEIVQMLLENGANPNSKNKDGDTPFMIAVENNDIECVKLLLKHGADPKIQYSDGYTTISVAAENGCLDIVKLLLDIHVDPNIPDNNGYTAFMRAAMNDHIDILQILLDYGVNPNITDSKGIATLFFASQSGKTAIVKLLLEHGANPNIITMNGNIPLLVAAEKNHIDIVKLLLENGAEINIKHKNGLTALMFAILNGHTKIVDILLASGANPNIQDSKGHSALYFATLNGNIELVEKLLEQPGIQNTMDTTGKTLLEYALEGRFEDEINGLLISRFEVIEVDTPWVGWTQSDVSRLETIFGEPSVAINFSSCPVCLKYIERSEACMYMKHNCQTDGYYHKELYNKYKNEEGKICWCTICGRIAKGHRHYKLRDSNAPKPNDNIDLLQGGDPFESDCSRTSNGGGLPEKYVRFRGMVDTAHDLMEVEGITRTTALNSLVEATWNAPLIASANIATNFITKKPFRTNFPRNSIENISNRVIPVREFPRPSPNRNNPELQPIVHSHGFNSFFQMEDEGEVIQFRHRMENGEINNHEETFISKESLEFVLENKIKKFGDDSSIYCWEHPKCTAFLYPEEVNGLVGDDLYERYKAMFNRQMTERGMKGGRQMYRIRMTKRRRRQQIQRRRVGQRGGQQENFFKEAMDAECVIVPKPVSKGGRRYRTMKRSRQHKTIRRGRQGGKRKTYHR